MAEEDPHFFVIDKAGNLRWWRDGDDERTARFNWLHGYDPFVAIEAVRRAGEYADDPELWIRAWNGDRYHLYWRSGRFLDTFELRLEYRGCTQEPIVHGWSWPTPLPEAP